MYAVAEIMLAELLGKQAHPQLMNTKFDYDNYKHTIHYKDLLQNEDKKPDKNLCRDAARVIVRELKYQAAIAAFGSRQFPKAELWSKQLCRGLGAPGRNKVDSPWWFEAELVKRWERVYASERPGKRRDKVMEAIRPMLAICYDWNHLLRLVTMFPGGGIPVITGQGRHQPIDSTKSKKYDPQERVVFIGGFQQVFVLFVPQELVANYW